MKLGLLQCDHVMDHLQIDHGDYPHMFNQLLTRYVPGLELRGYDVIGGVVPEDIDACDGYIISGSRHSVYDDLDWIAPARELVRELDRRRKPTVGICFGHQLIANALGGQVEKTVEKGWGAGVQSWNILTRRPWMDTEMDAFSLLAIHQDQVLKLPAGAEVLATSDFCPIAAYQIGDHMLGIQGHPEFTKPLVQGILQVRRDLMGAQRADEARASLDTPVQSDAVARWIRNFLRQNLLDAKVHAGETRAPAELV